MNSILLALYQRGWNTRYIRITGGGRLDIEPCPRGMMIKSQKGNHSFTTFADSAEIVPEIPSEANADNWTHPTP